MIVISLNEKFKAHEHQGEILISNVRLALSIIYGVCVPIVSLLRQFDGLEPFPIRSNIGPGVFLLYSIFLFIYVRKKSRFLDMFKYICVVLDAVIISAAIWIGCTYPESSPPIPFLSIQAIFFSVLILAGSFRYSIPCAYFSGIFTAFIYLLVVFINRNVLDLPYFFDLNDIAIDVSFPLFNELFRVIAFIITGWITGVACKRRLTLFINMLESETSATKNASETIDKTRLMARTISNSTEEIFLSSKNIYTTANNQAVSIQEIENTINQNLSIAADIAEKTNSVADIALKTENDVNSGFSVLEHNIRQIEDIKEKNDGVINGIILLGNKINQIRDIIKTINNITNQTKVIAFNAALEAASAGEQGKRFSVVAAEVNRLADDIAALTKQIRGRIEEIQSSSSSLIISGEESAEKIREGNSLIGELEEIFSEIRTGAEITANQAQIITTSTHKQQKSSGQICIAISDITAGLNNFLHSTEIATASADGLNKIIEELNALLNKGTGKTEETGSSNNDYSARAGKNNRIKRDKQTGHKKRISFDNKEMEEKIRLDELNGEKLINKIRIIFALIYSLSVPAISIISGLRGYGYFPWYAYICSNIFTLNSIIYFFYARKKESLHWTFKYITVSLDLTVITASIWVGCLYMEIAPPVQYLSIWALYYSVIIMTNAFRHSISCVYFSGIFASIIYMAVVIINSNSLDLPYYFFFNGSKVDVSFPVYNEVFRVFGIIVTASIIAIANKRRLELFTSMVESENKITKSVTSTVEQTRSIAKTIRKSTDEIFLSSKNIFATANNQAASIQEIESTISENSKIASDISEKTGSVANIASKMEDDVKYGFAILGRNINQMEQIKTKNDRVTSGIIALGNQIVKINDIIKTINTINDQTKVIAFNAALEAASAGDNQVKRFSSVASEVKRLAEKIAELTRQIREQIDEIQNSSSSLIISGKDSAARINEGNHLIKKLEEIFYEIRCGAEITSNQAQTITVSTQQQQKSIEQINVAIVDISTGLLNFLNSTEIARASAENLTQVIVKFDELLNISEQGATWQ